jgi:hypothetical protein
MKSIRSLVGDVFEAAVAQGMDVSPSDIGFIISLFLEGMVHNGPSPANATLQAIADECSLVE